MNYSKQEITDALTALGCSYTELVFVEIERVRAASHESNLLAVETALAEAEKDRDQQEKLYLFKPDPKTARRLAEFDWRIKRLRNNIKLLKAGHTLFTSSLPDKKDLEGLNAVMSFIEKK